MVNAAITDKSAETVANTLLNKWFWIYGIPESILSDQGKEFRTLVMDSICNLLDIERIHTTAGHPECDRGV